MSEIKPVPVIKIAARSNQNTQQSKEEKEKLALKAKTTGANDVIISSNPKFKNKAEEKEAK